MMSNSASWKGGASLFFTTLTRVVVPDDFIAVLDGADLADVQAHGGVELQGVAAGGGLGVAEHHPDLHADLVDEDHRGHGSC